MNASTSTCSHKRVAEKASMTRELSSVAQLRVISDVYIHTIMHVYMYKA